MIVYESKLTQRDVAKTFKRQPNFYAVHQFVDGMIAGTKEEGDKLRSPFVFDSIIDQSNNSAHISVRTIAPTNLPSERKVEYKFSVGDTVRFMLHYLPTSHSHNNRHTFIKDRSDRELRTISSLERKGLEVVLVEEQSIEHRQFVKRNRNNAQSNRNKSEHAFTQSSARHIVEATVTDVALFEEAIAYGVGRKSSFGYGKITFIGE